MLRLITTRRLSEKNRALLLMEYRAEECWAKLEDALTDVGLHRDEKEAAMERLADEQAGHAEAMNEMREQLDDVKLAALEIAAEVLDDHLNDGGRRQRIASVLAKHGDQLLLGCLPASIWQHVTDVAAGQAGAPGAGDDDSTLDAARRAGAEIAEILTTPDSHCTDAVRSIGRVLLRHADALGLDADRLQAGARVISQADTAPTYVS